MSWCKPRTEISFYTEDKKTIFLVFALDVVIIQFHNNNFQASNITVIKEVMCHSECLLIKRKMKSAVLDSDNEKTCSTFRLNTAFILSKETNKKILVIYLIPAHRCFMVI